MFGDCEEMVSSVLNRENTELVSVIVPVFNSRSFLGECVDSILQQDYSSFEIILIDDGSTDGSAEMCERLEKEYPSIIRAVHQKNEGPAAARNRGIELSRGRVVIFVDSDDIVSPHILSVMIDVLHRSKADMVRFPLPTPFEISNQFRTKAYRGVTSTFEVVDSEAAARKILYQEWECGPFLGAFRRDLMASNLFPDAVIGEDLLATLNLITKCKSIAFISDRTLYGYRVVDGGLTRGSVTQRKIDSAIMISRLLQSGPALFYPNLSSAFSARCFSLLRMVFAQVEFRSNEAAVLFAEMRKFRKTVLFDSNGRVRERIAAAIAILGFTPFSVFCKLCRRFGLMR